MIGSFKNNYRRNRYKSNNDRNFRKRNGNGHKVNVDFNKEGIIGNDNVFIMNEPSSGSDVHSVINKGERVEIIGEGELWYEIEFRDQIKFIRKKNLLVID